VDFAFEGLNAETSFIKAGHLCILPTIPMVHQSFVLYGDAKSIMDWGRIISPEEKVKEAHECQKLYNTILDALHRYL